MVHSWKEFSAYASYVPSLAKLEDPDKSIKPDLFTWPITAARNAGPTVYYQDAESWRVQQRCSSAL
jgi:hypothetical protein